MEVVFYKNPVWLIPIVITIILAGLKIWASIDKDSFIKCIKNIWNICKIIFSSIFGVIVFFILYPQIIKLKSIIKPQKLKISLLEDALNEAIKKISKIESKDEPCIKRWEEINSKSIFYGSISYPPMLDIDATGNSIGIGIDLLTKIFGRNIKKRIGTIEWDTMADKLYSNDNDKKIDIIATPIFETNERSKLMSFTLPIFYSEIGIYVKAGKHFNKTDESCFTFTDAIGRINKFKDNSLQANCIRGEISQHLLSKHFPDKIKQIYKPHELLISSLLESIIIENNEKSDLVFLEVYQVDKFKKGKIENGETQFENLINILKPNELLYPVVFALRKEDYILKNYLNLKLIEINNHGSGIIELIKESLIKLNENLNADEIKKYFIREYHK